MKSKYPLKLFAVLLGFLCLVSSCELLPSMEGFMATAGKIVYEGNGQTGGAVPSDPVVHSYQSLVTVLGNPNQLEKFGYSFAGWNTGADGRGTAYKENDTFVMPSKVVKLWAQWSDQLTLSYSANGATGGTVPAPQTAKSGRYLQVSGNTGAMTLTGKVFSGWNIKADGSGTAYLPNDSMALYNNTLLYAIWKVGYTLSYDANGATGGTVPQSTTVTAASNQSMYAASNSGNLVRTGFTFNGWNTKADGSGTSYGTNVYIGSLSSDLVLYAKWVSDLSVTYDANGATSGTAPAVAYFAVNTSVYAANNIGNLDRTGFSFSGWNTKADGSGTSYNVGAFMGYLNANLTLYAKWQPKYSVTYDANGATAGTVPNTAEYTGSESVWAASNSGNLAKTGAIFNGWNTKADGSGTSYSAGGYLGYLSANLTLYAVWQGVYTVTYHANGATGGTVPASATYGAATTAYAAYNSGSLAKTGFIFGGWNTQADGTGFTFVTGATISNLNANMDLHARWRTSTTNLVYNANGATSGSVPASPVIGSPSNYTVTGNTGSLVKGGNDFFGWNTRADGSGVNCMSGTVLYVDTDMVLYANWTPLPLPVDNLWHDGRVPVYNAVVWYAASVTPGTSYTLYWDDIYSGSGRYSANVYVGAYQSGLATTYFTYLDSGYSTGRTFTAAAGQSSVYIRINSAGSYNTGTFALKLKQN